MEGEGKGSQIFCLTWVKRNAAKLIPDQIGLSTEELQQVIKGDDENGDDEWDDVSDTGSDTVDDVNGEASEEEQDADEENYDDLKEFDMDNYDGEDDKISSGVSEFIVFADNDDDPYLTKKSKLKPKEDVEKDESDSEGEEEEKSAVELKPDDNLLVCARCSQNSSILEVYVYNHSNGDFYVHHDIPLMEMPLCMQWIGFDPGAVGEDRGNLLAVGNFNSVIDIWDLDILNTLEPVFSIGQAKKKKKQKKSDFQHSDAILDLAWTSSLKDKLASSSADTAVALWDLELGKATQVFRGHQDKVQTIEWKPDSGDCLLSGAFDGRVLELDARKPKHGAEWELDGEIERVAWSPVGSDYFVAGNDSGVVFYLDRRNPGKVVHQWAAHEGSVPGLVMTKTPAPRKTTSALLYTASSEGCVKLWDLNEEKATLVHERDMKMGMVHCCQGNPDETSVVAAGGQKDNVRLWDIKKTPEVLNYFGMKDADGEGVSGDTLEPEGGGGENDEDVIKYIEGEDYINVEKIKRLEKEAKRNETAKSNDTKEDDSKSADGKKKRKRKRKKTNSANPQEALCAPQAQVTVDEKVNTKKKRKRKKKKPKALDGAVDSGNK